MGRVAMPHNWSGWPGAFCLNCGIEHRVEAELVGNHRYTELPHVDGDCAGCAGDGDECPGAGST